MCNQRIKIKNNSDYINPEAYVTAREVNCGHCWQCQMQLQSDYAIRGYYEYQECLKDGGYVYWDTLTYRESKLPRICRYLTDDGKGLPCFSKSHVQKFLKRVRKQLADDYSITKDAFRYLVVSEYGEKFGRPHYHIMYFVHDPFLTLDILHQVTRSQWRKYHGNTDFHCEPNGRVLTSTAAIHYVTKYISKVDARLKGLRKKIDDVCISRGLPTVSIRTFNKYFQPWQLHSLGFGRYLIDCDSQYNNLIDLCCSMPTKDNPGKLYRLPMYYIRARFDNKPLLRLFDIRTRLDPTIENPDPLNPKHYKRYWVGTQKLLEVKKRLWEQSIKDIRQSLFNKIYNLETSYNEAIKFNSDLIRDLSSLESCDPGRPYSYANNVAPLVRDIDVTDLAIYVSDYRYKSCSLWLGTDERLALFITRQNEILLNPYKYGNADELEQSEQMVVEPRFENLLFVLDKVYRTLSEKKTDDEELQRLKKLDLKGSLPLAYKQLY